MHSSIVNVKLHHFKFRSACFFEWCHTLVLTRDSSYISDNISSPFSSAKNATVTLFLLELLLAQFHKFCQLFYNIIQGAGLVQWWECLLPTNVAQVWFPDPASYVGWVCCLFSTLLWEVFLRVLRFSSLLKNQHFQIPVRSWNARTLLNEFLWTP